MMQLEKSDSLLPLRPYRAYKSAPMSEHDQLIPYPSKTHMKPLPLVRKNISRDTKMKSRLVIRGDKYFSKVVASGNDTLKTLERIKKSLTRLIISFELDPYFCDATGIKPLCKLSKKLAMNKELSIVIRRIAQKDELGFVASMYNHLFRLEKFRIEFPSTPNFNDADIIYLCSKFKKGHYLKRLEANLVSLPQITEKGIRAFSSYLMKLPRLEELSKSVFKKKTIQYDTPISPFFSFAKLPRLKKLSNCLGISTSGWMTDSDYSDKFITFHTRSISSASNLVDYTAKFDKYQINSSVILALVDTLSKLKQLRHFTLELLNTQIDDFDMLLFAERAAQFSQIEQLTVKIIQFPNLSENCIYEFVGHISRCLNLKKFDLYFRRLVLPPEGVVELGEKLQSLKNLEWSSVNQSIHVYRRS